MISDNEILNVNNTSNNLGGIGKMIINNIKMIKSGIPNPALINCCILYIEDTNNSYYSVHYLINHVLTHQEFAFQTDFQVLVHTQHYISLIDKQMIILLQQPHTSHRVFPDQFQHDSIML